MTKPPEDRDTKLYTLAGVENLFKKNLALSKWDRANGNKSIGYEKILDTPDLKYYHILMSNKTRMLKLVLRVGRGVDLWFILTPTDPQAKSLINEFPRIFSKTIYDNEREVIHLD